MQTAELLVLVDECITAVKNGRDLPPRCHGSVGNWVIERFTTLVNTTNSFDNVATSLLGSEPTVVPEPERSQGITYSQLNEDTSVEIPYEENGVQKISKVSVKAPKKLNFSSSGSATVDSSAIDITNGGKTGFQRL